MCFSKESKWSDLNKLYIIVKFGWYLYKRGSTRLKTQREKNLKCQGFAKEPILKGKNTEIRIVQVYMLFDVYALHRL